MTLEEMEDDTLAMAGLIENAGPMRWSEVAARLGWPTHRAMMAARFGLRAGVLAPADGRLRVADLQAGNQQGDTR